MASPSVVAPATLAIGHPTATIYLDETGVLSAHPHDPYFGIGCLKTTDGGDLGRKLRSLRSRYGYHDELHWADFDKSRLRGRNEIVQMAKDAIDIAFTAEHVCFAVAIASSKRGSLVAKYRSHKDPAEAAYAALATQVLTEIVAEDELVTVLADQRDSPRDTRFEHDVKHAVDQHHGRLTIVTLNCLDSRCTDGLQLIDLLLGAATLDLRQGRRDDTDTQKQALLAHLLDRCDQSTFRPGGYRDPTGKFTVTLLKPPRARRRGNTPRA
jgi:hypothetical protein